MDATDISLSPDQQEALDAVWGWYEDPHAPATLTLGGYAGTGKTTILRRFTDEAARRGLVTRTCAFTGKAVSVLESKGIAATTLHRLIYTPTSECTLCGRPAKGFCKHCDTGKGIKVAWHRVPHVDADLVIVDEASMLNSRLVADLESLASRVLYVGDHGQLEPIGNDPGLMRSPELRLERIHRQAEGSSIIRFAHHLREGGRPETFGSVGEVEVHRSGMVSVDDFDMMLCGYNNTRAGLNAFVRKERGYTEILEPGERIICLQNDKALNIYNGMLATVLAVEDVGAARLEIDFEDDNGWIWRGVPTSKAAFGLAKKPDWRASRGVALFDYGYAMTVHKAQGSEWERVAVFEQLHPDWTAPRWRYTAATRASKKLAYFVS